MRLFLTLLIGLRLLLNLRRDGTPLSFSLLPRFDASTPAYSSHGSIGLFELSADGRETDFEASCCLQIQLHVIKKGIWMVFVPSQQLLELPVRNDGGDNQAWDCSSYLEVVLLELLSIFADILVFGQLASLDIFSSTTTHRPLIHTHHPRDLMVGEFGYLEELGKDGSMVIAVDRHVSNSKREVTRYQSL